MLNKAMKLSYGSLVCYVQGVSFKGVPFTQLALPSIKESSLY